MTTTAIRRTASAAIAVLLMAAGAAMSVTPAHADAEKDQTFIDYLDKKGVPYKNRTQAIRVAKNFCVAQTRQGNPNWLAGYKLQYAQGWTQTETENFVNGAVPTYCPKLWE
jgi:Protein of unknown function (DUF732)